MTDSNEVEGAYITFKFPMHISRNAAEHIIFQAIHTLIEDYEEEFMPNEVSMGGVFLPSDKVPFEYVFGKEEIEEEIQAHIDCAKLDAQMKAFQATLGPDHILNKE